MSDIAKCMDIHCPSKDFCYRFTAPESEFRQAYGNFNRESDAYNCDMFWEDPKERAKNLMRLKDGYKESK